MTRSIESCGKRHLSDGHADPVGQSLPQWPCGRLDTRSLAVFWMPRRATAPLTKPLEFLNWQVEARDMKQRVQQRTPMSGRQNKSIPIRPVGIVWVEFERSIPERVRHRRRAHGQTGMARVGLLHHVDGQKAKRVDAQLIQC